MGLLCALFYNRQCCEILPVAKTNENKNSWYWATGKIVPVGVAGLHATQSFGGEGTDVLQSFRTETISICILTKLKFGTVCSWLKSTYDGAWHSVVKNER